MEITVAEVLIDVVEGDITQQPQMEVVVNSANASLLPGGGVSGAIHRVAGPQLFEECGSKAPIQPGQAVITSAYRLPNRYVVHCLGPVFGQDHPEARILASCYRNALRLSDAQQARSIAFPSISTGIFGYPLEEAAEVAVATVVDIAPTLRYLRWVRWVVWGHDALEAYAAALLQQPLSH